MRAREYQAKCDNQGTEPGRTICRQETLRKRPTARSCRCPHVVPVALKAAAVNEHESGCQLKKRSENDDCWAQINAKANNAQPTKDEDGELWERPWIEESHAKKQTTSRQYSEPS